MNISIDQKTWLDLFEIPHPDFFLVLFNSVESITHGGPPRLTSTVFTEHPWNMMIPKMEKITTEMTMAHLAAVSLLKNMFRKKYLRDDHFMIQL